MTPSGTMTLAQALDDTERRFAAAGIEGARAESWRVLAHATGLARERLFASGASALTPRQSARLACVVSRRAAHEPWALIARRREFWSLEFKVTRATLVPRPDSECLIETALAWIADHNRPLRVLDLGTGSGCLLLALLSELPNATGVGVDASGAAIKVAARNARTLGFDRRAAFVAGDWGSAIDGTFDVVLANPPYVADWEWPGLDADVRLYEPPSALLAGADGLAAYRALAPDLARLLAPGGLFVGEIGRGQTEPATRVLGGAGLAVRSIGRDLSGIPRCLLATLGRNEGSDQVWV